MASLSFAGEKEARLTRKGAAAGQSCCYQSEPTPAAPGPKCGRRAEPRTKQHNVPPPHTHTHQMCSDRKAARPRFFAAVSHSGSEGPYPAPPPPPTWPTPSSRHFPGEHRLLHPSPAQAGGGGEGRKEGERREDGGWTAQSRGRLSRGRTLTGLREQFALDEREGSALKAERWEGSGGRWGWVVVVRHSGGRRRREDG